MNRTFLMKKLLRPNGKDAFLMSLPRAAEILDVGCGNNSPFRTKKILPKCIYTGIDIGDYNQSKPNLADEYIVTTPENFSSRISELLIKYDAVISSHNLEHCHDRDGTLLSMMSVLKVGGKIYLSFPCEKSVFFPKRDGTLNYYDDPTHQLTPPSFEKVGNLIKKNGFDISYSTRNYKPRILWLLGLLNEPISRYKSRNLVGTWEFYGFGSIFIATKIK